MLIVKDLALKYNEKTIFENLSFKLGKGEILAVKGKNGSGKTSLCLALAGLMRNEEKINLSGDIFYDGKNISGLSIFEKCLEVGLVFQNPENQIFSPLVTEEMVFAPENLAILREEMARRLQNTLKICGIEHLKSKKTSELSGGEKQLLALASVLTMQPKLLIVDEITSRIDSDNKEKVHGILKDYAKQGNSVIIVTHSEKDLEIADKLLLMGEKTKSED
ncbi:MAG: ABC transporter ATP-binding protein [Clostridia bacterium]|jgi:energy-coupling factor transporter ATP-binding protein EcfA2|nr:ABC transporter ATP-binding protein [Clostridia bacterium]OQC14148.1 MAG: Energy-coupling factor transporter ATP-binding protein EcfA1 [Firmicutes bacterium ADurb.Bin080]